VAGRILIIDDDPVNVKILGDFLLRKGFEVDRANDGEQALARVERQRPDLVLLDVLLPKINGLDLCRRIKKAQNPPPVFLMSAVYRSPSIQRDAQAEYGADAYFVKPFRMQDLWRHIEERLGVRRPDGGAPLEGDLAAVGLPRLLVTLHAAEETGALKLEHLRVERILYLERGLPIAVESNLRSEKFEQFLQEHAVSPELLADAEERASWERRHVEERMVACFLMREGTFEFVPAATPRPELPRAEVPVPQLVLEGVRRHLPLLELSHEIELLRRRVVHATPDAAAALMGIRLADEQARVLAAIDGHSTVEDIITRTGLPSPTAMQILFGFILLGVAAVEETAREA